MSKSEPAGRRPPAPQRDRRWWIEVAIVAAAFFAVQLFVTRDVVRGPLPPLDGVLADGTSITAKQWQRMQSGDAFLLYVWATWCPICTTIEGSIDAVARDAPMLTVAMQSGSAAEVERFLAARGHRRPALIDNDAHMSRQLGVNAVPTLIFVDRAGQVRAVTQGYTSEIGMRLRLWWTRRYG